MRTIDQLLEAIRPEDIRPDHSYRLERGMFSSKLTDRLFAGILQTDVLVFENAAIQKQHKQVTVSGTVAFPKHEAQPFSLCFEENENGFVVVTGELHLGGPLASSLPAIEWLHVAEPRKVIALDEAQLFPTLSYCGHIPVKSSGKKIPVRITVEDGDAWRLDIAGEDAGHSISLQEIAEMTGGRTLAGYLPASLVKELNTVSLTGIHAIFTHPKAAVRFFQVGLKVGSGWKIAPQLELEDGLHLSLLTSFPGTDNYTLTAGIAGTVKTGSVSLPLFLTVTTGSFNSLSFGIQPGKQVPLLSLPELLAFADNEHNWDFPDSLKALPSISIVALDAEFDLSAARFNNFSFGLTTTADWEIIPEYFHIEQLFFDLQMVRGNKSWDIRGLARGQFRIGETALTCTLLKENTNPDWTVSAKLKPGSQVNLSKVIAQLLSGKDYIPGSVPDVTFSQLEITVVPAAKNFSFTAASDQPWKFNDNVSITNFNLAFTCDAHDAKNPIKGHIGGSIVIGTTETVTINLSAALGETSEGGLQLEGSTSKGLIPVGHLAAYIAKSFNAKAEIPEWLSEIKLSEMGAGYHTKSGNFHFEVTGKFPVAGSPLTVKIKFTLENDGHNRFTRKLSGKLFTGDHTEFDLDIENSPSGTRVSGKWEANSPDGYLRFEELAHTLGFTPLPAIPDKLKLSLVGASFLYDSKEGRFVINAQSEHSGKAVFVSEILANKKRFYGFGITVKLDVKLADLPLVGNKIPDAENIGIKEGNIWILSSGLSTDDVTQLNASIADTDAPKLPAGPVTASVLLHAALNLGKDHVKLLDLALGKSKAQPHSEATADDNAPSSPTWIDVQKQFGVFHFGRIGFSYSSGNLEFLLDAGMDLGPLEFTFDGLSITSPLTEFKPHFDLSGLALAYTQGALNIEGALRKLPEQQLDAATLFRFDGLAAIKAGKFSLAAIGSYAQLRSGDPSLFLFAQAEAAIGGPPAFFVTGVMAGFGFNRSLLFPEMDEVATFPFLLLAEPPHAGGKAPTQGHMHMLNVLDGTEAAVGGGEKKQWVTTKPGQYWLALGVHFTSFQLVRSRALLAAQFGNDLSFALLGTSTLQLPQTGDGNHPYVFAELQLRALLQPREGFFGLSALLTGNSYVLTPDCHLTGGFAMYTWFGSNKHAGQFVVTMGGYHPAFSKPGHYPALPQLGFNWVVSPSVSIKGGAYFALTPSCVMAGGALEAVYRDGSLKAWFTAHADFLMAWRPFFFTATIGVSIGVDLHAGSDDTQSGLSFSVSADLNLWGPPTGGKARVHVVFTTFTVHFGSEDASANNNALQWHAFSDLLPHHADVCRVTATDGMAGTAKDSDANGNKVWIVRPGTFRFSTESAVPSGELTYGTAKNNVRDGVADNAPKLIDIRPMNKTGVRSVHHVEVSLNGKAVDCAKDGWKFEPRSTTMPDALWGKPPAHFTQIPSAPDASMTGPLLSGFDVTPPTPVLGSSPGAVALKSLAFDYLQPEGNAPISANTPPSGEYTPVADAHSLDVVKTIGTAPAQQSRDEMCRVLQSLGLYNSTTDAMTRLADECAHLYDNPVLLKK